MNDVIILPELEGEVDNSTSDNLPLVVMVVVSEETAPVPEIINKPMVREDFGTTSRFGKCMEMHVKIRVHCV